MVTAGGQAEHQHPLAAERARQHHLGHLGGEVLLQLQFPLHALHRLAHLLVVLAQLVDGLLSESATGPLSAAVPTTRPIARARKTAVRDTTWYRKLITLEAS
ncbi:hypothetical protein GCM10029963_18360 [Micromonospora andamanensis]